MSKLRLALGLATAASSVVVTAPAHAFPCSAPINTGPVGVSGVATVQVCTEGVRVLPTGEVTTAGQVGVTILGSEECVGQGRGVVDTSPIGYSYDPRGTFGTPLYLLTCP